MYVYKSMVGSRVTNAHHIINSALTGLRSPAGPRRLRDSDTHKRIAVPKALCVLRERPPTKAQKRQSLPFYPLATQGFRNVRNAPRVVIPPPTQNTTCFAVCALVCDFSPKAECVPTFTRESEHGPFVREAEKHDERWSEIELLLIVRVHREPGNVCI